MLNGYCVLMKICKYNLKGVKMCIYVFIKKKEIWDLYFGIWDVII